MRWRSRLLARSTARDEAASNRAAVSRYAASGSPDCAATSCTLTVYAPATFATLPVTNAFTPIRSATSRATESSTATSGARSILASVVRT